MKRQNSSAEIRPPSSMAAEAAIERPFAFTGPDNVFREQGLQRNRGLELSFNGEIGQRWALYGGLTWLNARLGKHERVFGLTLRDSLPKTMIGKLDRKALREEVLGG